MFVVAGESLIDLVSTKERRNGRIELVAHPGGSPYNCAIALSRLGNRTGYLCPISRDNFGDYLLEPLHAAGVRTLLDERVEAPTTLAVVTLNARGEASYAFYRSADRAFTREGLLAALPEDVSLLQVGGFCPIEPDDAEAWLAVAQRALERGATISIDPNVRPSLVENFGAYRERLGRFLDLAHIIKVSDEDLAALDGGKPIEAHAADLLGRPNCRLVIVTRGSEGSRAFTRRASAEAGIYAPPSFVDTVGAGDTLMAAALTHLALGGNLSPDRLDALDAGQLGKVLEYGAVAAGINCGRAGASPPNRSEIDMTLAARAEAAG